MRGWQFVNDTSLRCNPPKKNNDKDLPHSSEGKLLIVSTY